MLALYLIPALLALAFFISDDDDDTEEVIVDEVTPSEPTAPNVIIATPEQDILEGTSGADRMTGNEMSNEILGEGGNDLIEGRGGNDAIVAGDGNDTVLAGDGDDFVSGGAGNDRVFLGDGDDEYVADDDISEMAGDDFVRGGDGRDFIIDLLGSNELRGDLGRDTLIAFDGLNEDGNYFMPSELGATDTLSGGFGNDHLAGDDGDLMTGGIGNDVFYATDDKDEDLSEVRITDFNPTEDSLVVVQLNGFTDLTVLSYETTAQGVRVSFEGRSVAFLEGLGAGSVANIQTSVIRITDLDSALGFEAA